MTPANNDKMQALTDTARRVMPEGGEAYLFGSRARGEARSDSDWDVLVLLDTDRITNDDFSRYGYPFMELGWDIDAMICPIMYTKKDWERSSFTPFYKNVMQDRIRL